MLGLIGCSDNQKETLTLSFSGEHDFFAISNGSIILDDEEEVFEGGNLEVVRPDLFEDVVSFSTTFYTVRNEKKHIILSGSTTDQTGGTININGDLGGITGDNIIGKEVESLDNLWFELETIALDGNENIYQLQLTLTD
ncbi:MAG: hypothetical protein IJC39_05985 [Firmicutes bacterium]|nr:hypothetical protein [Bacillota bacterium]